MKGRGSWIGRVVVLAMIAAGACAQHRSTDPFAIPEGEDPFDDEFFTSSFESSAIDEVFEGPAPSVGWLYEGDAGPEEALRDHADPFWDDAPYDRAEKSFGEKAQEASLATLSILVGAGMTALPFLVGT